MNYIIRQTEPGEVRAALDLALRVFMEYEAPLYGKEALEKFINDCILSKQYAGNYISGRHLILGAFAGDKIVGMMSERGDGHISMAFVDKAYHRQGIATSMMEKMTVELKLRGYNTITLNSSPYGLPFYRHFGFTDTGPEQKKDGFIFTPMSYTPGELWDIYDKNRIKTGRIVERGRTMKQDEYHIVVHVWIRNSRNEYLISKRTPNKTFPLLWECTGGSALTGEDSYTAAIREAKEELGVDLSECEGRLLFSFLRQNHNFPDFCDVWLFHTDVAADTVVLQEGETCGAMWADREKINSMIDSGLFIGRKMFFYLDELFATE